MRRFILLLASIILAVDSLYAADLLDELGLRKSGNSAALNALSQDEVISALKEALAKGVQHAITNLGRTNGFLQDATVRVPVPESLRPVERGLRAIGQSHLVDEFEISMNRAAERAVPEAAIVLADAIRQMTIADAKSIVTSTNAAATDYFRRTESTNLYERLLPIVKKSTEEIGVTSAYKRMLEKIDSNRFDGLSALGGLLSKNKTLDLDSYVTQKALDGLFLKIAEQEKLIRENPAARTTELLERVFGAFRR